MDQISHDLKTKRKENKKLSSLVEDMELRFKEKANTTSKAKLKVIKVKNSKMMATVTDFNVQNNIDLNNMHYSHSINPSPVPQILSKNQSEATI